MKSATILILSERLTLCFHKNPMDSHGDIMHYSYYWDKSYKDMHFFSWFYAFTGLVLDKSKNFFSSSCNFSINMLNYK